MIKLALIGGGRWGRNYIKAARDSGEAEISGTVSGRTLSEALAIVADADAAVIATPPSAAIVLAQQILATGKPVLVEKPAGLSVAQARYLEEAERASNGFVLVGHQHLFAEAVEPLRETSPMGSLTARWHGPGPVREFSALWDYGSHAAAVLLWAGGSSDVAAVPVYGCRPPTTYAARVRSGRRIHRLYVSSGKAEKIATLHSEINGKSHLLYDGYARAEPSLTRQVRAFAKAVRAGGTTDRRFGSGWAVKVAAVLEAIEGPLLKS